MEIDFRAIKALSSPTRVKILRHALENEATPTSLSDELGKSKSTVSSHLSKLEDSELLEKRSEDGRKRVVYQPTKKAKNIVKGRRKKVKFSLGASTVSSLIGIFFGYQGFQRLSFLEKKQDKAELSMQSMEAGVQTADKATASDPGSIISFSAEIFLFLGALFITIAAVSFIYGVTMNQLGEKLN